MRILFLNADLGYGGAEKSIVFAANQMAEKGHEVYLLTYRSDTVCRQINEKVVHEHIQLEQNGGSIKSVLFCASRIRRYIKKNRFDAAVAFLSASHLRLSLACLGLKTKVILSQRGDPYSVKKNIVTRISDIIFQCADGFVFQTENAMNYYSARTVRNGTVIPNPCQKLTRTKPFDSENKVIVTASRFELKQKRQDILIKAYNIFYENHRDYQLHIFGDGDDYQLIREMADSNPSIVLMGKTDNIAEAIQQAAFFVLTSDYEGIPNVLIEAMSLGLPCISTKCSPGGAEFLIKDGVSGLLVDCADAVQLSDAMTRLSEDESLRKKLSQNAVYVNDTFRPEVIAEKWEKYILKVVSTNGKK